MPATHGIGNGNPLTRCLQAFFSAVTAVTSVKGVEDMVVSTVSTAITFTPFFAPKLVGPLEETRGWGRAPPEARGLAIH